MDNRLEFRAWHKVRKKYYKVLHLHLESYEGIWATAEGFDIIEQTDIHIDIQPKDIIVEQYTSFTDKYKNKCYEGDILMIEEDPGDIAIIFWKDGQLVVENKYGHPYSDEYGLKDTIEGSKLIGNIHQNKDLLETL